MRKLVILWIVVPTFSLIGAGMAAASTTPPPTPFHNVHVFPAAPAAEVPLVNYCASGETQVGLYNIAYGYVAQWSSKLNHFVVASSGHTILCLTDKTTINGNWYFEYRAVLNGKESNDCVSTGNRRNGGVVGLNGCVAGQKDELWANFTNLNQTLYWIVSDAADACVADGIGILPDLIFEGTSTAGNDCGPSGNYDSQDWDTLAG